MNRRSFFLAAAKSLMAAGVVATLTAGSPAEASPGKLKATGKKRRRRRRRKGKKVVKKVKP